MLKRDRIRTLDYPRPLQHAHLILPSSSSSSSASASNLDNTRCTSTKEEQVHSIKMSGSLRLALKQSMMEVAASQTTQAVSPAPTASGRNTKRNASTASAGSRKKTAAVPSATTRSSQKTETKPPPNNKPEQVFPLGTKISKCFVDPQTDKPRNYKATVQRYDYVPDKDKWLYYVHYETDDEGEYVSEHCVKKNRLHVSVNPKELFVHYFASMFGFFRTPFWGKHQRDRRADMTVDWKRFARDLGQQPELAMLQDTDTDHEDATSGAFALQYVLMIPKVPVSVVKSLIAKNPEALQWNAPSSEQNTLQWMIGSSMISGDGDDDYSTKHEEWAKHIHPDILRLLLDNGESDWSLQIDMEDGSLDRPIDWFIRWSSVADGGPAKSPHVEAMFSSSPDAVAWVLYRIYTMEETVPPGLLTMALNFATSWELSSSDEDDGGERGFFNTDLIPGGYGDQTLVDIIFDNLENGKVGILRRILNIKIKAIRRAREKILFGPQLEVSIDTTSLTCMVLSCLAEWKRVDLWSNFAEAFPEALAKPTKNGSPPLVTAIRLGYQWEPVLKSLVEADPKTLELLDARELLPPFLTAATVIYDWHRLDMDVRGDSYLQRDMYKSLNSVNNTFEMLRTNPNIIRHDLIANPSAVATKKKATKKPASTNT